MRSEIASREDMWSELIDRDLNLLIDGKEPHNNDLAPLKSFVNTLGNFGLTELSPGLLEHHVAEGAAAARSLLSDTAVPLSTNRRLIYGLRRRITAAATSLMMIVGMTGVAWAADSAAPGDWNYGLDRALESIGIGDGGAEERLRELAVIGEDRNPRRVEIASHSGQSSAANSDDPVVGLEKAASTVDTTTRGSQRATDVGEAVAALLAYLANPEGVDRPNIAELAQQFKEVREPPGSNRPVVNPGKQRQLEYAGKPDSPSNR